MNNRFKNTILVLAGTVIVGGVGIGAYLAGSNFNTEKSANTQQPMQQQSDFGQGGPGSMQFGGGMDFSQYVESGIIDQDTADKMEEYMQEQMQSMQENRQSGAQGERPDMYAGMVEAGIITQDQADEIESSMSENMPSMGGSMPPMGNGQGTMPGTEAQPDSDSDSNFQTESQLGIQWDGSSEEL